MIDTIQPAPIPEQSETIQSVGIIPIWAARYFKIPYLKFGRDRHGCDDWGLTRLIIAEQFGHAVWSCINQPDAYIYKVLKDLDSSYWIDSSESAPGQIACIQLGRDRYIFGVDLGDFRFLVQTKSGAKFFRPDPARINLFKVK